MALRDFIGAGRYEAQDGVILPSSGSGEVFRGAHVLSQPSSGLFCQNTVIGEKISTWLKRGISMYLPFAALLAVTVECILRCMVANKMPKRLPPRLGITIGLSIRR